MGAGALRLPVNRFVRDFWTGCSRDFSDMPIRYQTRYDIRCPRLNFQKLFLFTALTICAFLSYRSYYK